MHIDGVVVVELVEAVEVLHQVLTTSVDATPCACLVAGPAVVLVGLQVNAGVGAVRLPCWAATCSVLTALLCGANVAARAAVLGVILGVNADVVAVGQVGAAHLLARAVHTEQAGCT